MEQSHQSATNHYINRNERLGTDRSVMSALGITGLSGWDICRPNARLVGFIVKRMSNTPKGVAGKVRGQSTYFAVLLGTARLRMSLGSCSYCRNLAQQLSQIRRNICAIRGIRPLNFSGASVTARQIQSTPSAATGVWCRCSSAVSTSPRPKWSSSSRNAP